MDAAFGCVVCRRGRVMSGSRAPVGGFPFVSVVGFMLVRSEGALSRASPVVMTSVQGCVPVRKVADKSSVSGSVSLVRSWLSYVSGGDVAAECGMQ